MKHNFPGAANAWLGSMEVFRSVVSLEISGRRHNAHATAKLYTDLDRSQTHLVDAMAAVFDWASAQTCGQTPRGFQRDAGRTRALPSFSAPPRNPAPVVRALAIATVSGPLTTSVKRFKVLSAHFVIFNNRSTIAGRVDNSFQVGLFGG